MRTTEGTFDCGTVQLQRGGTLKNAKIVYKTFGTLSPARDNVIVMPTFYAGQLTDLEIEYDKVLDKRKAAASSAVGMRPITSR